MDFTPGMTRDERTKHIDLSSACIFNRRPEKYRKVVLLFFNLNEMPKGFECCHLCNYGQRKGNCSNPLHIYIGTRSENRLDIPVSVREAMNKKDFNNLSERQKYRRKSEIKLYREDYITNFKYSISQYKTVVYLRKENYSLRKISEITGISYSGIRNFLANKKAYNIVVSNTKRLINF